MKFMMLVDIEGVTAVTNYQQAEGSILGVDMLMHDIKAVLEGVLSNPENRVLIFDEHTDGCNIRMEELPQGVHVVRGKPVINGKWKGIDASFDGLIMVGFHARRGVEGALLPHSYAPQNKNITINQTPVGEIGVEAGVAGDYGVPLVLLSGDSAGCAEAEALAPGARTVAVKEALGEFYALCYHPDKTASDLRAAGASIAYALPKVAPVRYGAPVTVEIELTRGDFADLLKARHPEMFVGEDRIAMRGETVTQAWQQYLRAEKEVNHALGL